jgi:hypothetical protein
MPDENTLFVCKDEEGFFFCPSIIYIGKKGEGK